MDIDRMAEIITDRILRGSYKPGEKLSENRLAAEFECSRTPVREVLKRIEGERLVDILPYSGTYVRKFTLEESIEITEIRAYLESLAFELAAGRNADPSILSLLADQMEVILRAPEIDFVLFGKTHYNFHKGIVLLSGNRILQKVYANLGIGFAPVFFESMERNEIDMTIEEHRRIVELLRDHKVEEGRNFMYRHLWNKRERILSMVGKEEG